MKQYFSRYFDYRIGVAGALVMGIAVFCINFFSTDLITQSIFAALKQGIYTFFFGGFLMKGCEYIATIIVNDLLAILLAIIIPSMVTLLLTYSLHLMKGTPKPLESVIPTLAIIPATAVWAIKKRRQLKTSKANIF
jgi:hypothetical protein